jgi:Mrp family chromosome partitioning ATPase
MLGLDRSPGLTEVLNGHASVEEVTQSVPLERYGSPPADLETDSDATQPELLVITAGDAVSAPLDLLNQDATRTVLRRLAADNDIVIIDTPPVVPVGDTIALSVAADAILLVTAVNKLRRADIKELKEMLGRCSAGTIGLVTTGSAPGDASERHRSRYYDLSAA